MIDFERLLELLEKAEYGAECECSVTTRAYLKLALAEAYRLGRETDTPGERSRFARAAGFIERKIVSMNSVSEAAHFALMFWRGFENGWEEHTQPGRTSNAFKIGRKFATHDPSP